MKSSIIHAATCGAICCIISGCASDKAVFKGPKPGETWYVSTKSAIVRESPDGLAKAVRTLNYKTPVTADADIKVALPFSGDKKTFPDNLIPGWIAIKGGGYIPASSLASEWLISNQNPNEEVTAEGMSAAKRGFSESETDDELASMRGAAGSGRAASVADNAAVDRAIKNQRPMTDAELAEFVSTGELKRNPAKPEVLKVEEPGALSSFASGAKRLGATGLSTASNVIGQSDDENLKLAAAAGKTSSELLNNEIGPVQEFQLGRAVAARVLPLYKTLPGNDPRALYVNKIVHLIAAASNDPEPYGGLIVVTLDSDEVNAFAVPGGFVFITTRMLKFLQDEDELAAIIGHEIGHLELRHGMRAVGTEKVLKLFSLLKELGERNAGSNNDLLIAEVKALVDDVFTKLTDSVRNGYGIETESQADWRSLQLSHSLGYDTTALYDVLERFKKEKGTYGGASYPAERGKDVLKYKSQLSLDGKTAVGRAKRAARYKTAIGK